jgi:hypothetical protein
LHYLDSEVQTTFYLNLLYENKKFLEYAILN